MRGPYQWKRNGAAIAGATKYAYVVTADDVGTSLTCSATVTRPTKILAGPGYRLTSGVSLDNFAITHNQSAWATNSSGGSGVAPTASAPRITLNSGPTSGNYGRVIHRVPFTFGGLTSSDYFTFDLEFPAGNGVEGGDSISLQLSSDNLASKNLQLGITFQRYMEGRISLTFAAREFVASAGEVFDGTTFNYYAIRYTKGAASPGVSKQCVVHGIHRQAKARPKFVFQFDLGHSGAYTIAKDLFLARDMRASVNVTRAMIDTDPANFMSTSQLQDLHALGWDMGVRNGPTHDTFASVAALTAEMQAAKQWNIERGLTRGADHCIYPVGVMTANSKPALIAAGFKTARTTYTRVAALDVGAPDLYNLPCLSLGNADPVAAAKQFIDDAIAAGKTAFAYTHQVADVFPAGGIATAALAEILDYVAIKRDAGLIDVCTTSEWYDSLGLT